MTIRTTATDATVAQETAPLGDIVATPTTIQLEVPIVERLIGWTRRGPSSWLTARRTMERKEQPTICREGTGPRNQNEHMSTRKKTPILYSPLEIRMMR